MIEATLWIAQGFLALFFFAAGVPKVVARGMDRWVGFDDLPRVLVVVIGAGEITAAVAVVAPMLAGWAEWATPMAAMGLVVISLMAGGFHVREGELLPAIETTLWASLAASIAIARWDAMSTRLSISVDLLAPVVALLVPAIVANLVVLFRRPVRPDTAETGKPLVSAGTGRADRA